jgi:succinyl-diaminopimelate desuccinylase
MSIERLIKEEIQENREQYIEFLQDLIQINTSKSAGNIKDLILRMTEFLEEENVKCKTIPVEGESSNFVAYLNDIFDEKNLLFNGHMDVVPSGPKDTWKYPPFSATRKRKKIFGRGTADMKGGLAAMASALKILKKVTPDLIGNLIFNAVIDEEIGGALGTKHCIDNELSFLKMDFAIVGEPTGLAPLPKAIVVGEKGIFQVRVHTKGKQSHSSMPFLGKNAIDMMCKINRKLEKLETKLAKTPPPLDYNEIEEMMAQVFPNREIFHDILEKKPILKHLLLALTKSTCSFNIVQGGKADNVVPENCEGLIDFRLLEGQKPSDITEALSNIISELGFQELESLSVDSEETGVYVEEEFSAKASYWNNWEESRHLNRFYSLVEEIYGRKPFYFLYPACSDARFIRNTGYCQNTILFGPGSAGFAHATDEYIEVEDFLNAIKVYTIFAHDFLQNK